MYTAAFALVLLTAGAGQEYDSTLDDSAYDSTGSVEYNAIHGRGMPQTCYAPRYGCYPGNDRFMNRYPAFHGQYYRRPYNYRNLFDYPWHAELHEPTSMFSYDVPAAEEVPRGKADEPPRPPRDIQARYESRSVLKQIQTIGDEK